MFSHLRSIFLLVLFLAVSSASPTLAGRKQGHLKSGTTRTTGGVSAGSSSGTSKGGRAGSASTGQFTCLGSDSDVVKKA